MILANFPKNCLVPPLRSANVNLSIVTQTCLPLTQGTQPQTKLTEKGLTDLGPLNRALQ